MPKRVGVLKFGHIKLKTKSAIADLFNVTLTLKAFATFYVLLKHHFFAIYIDFSLPKGVNCRVNIHHSTLLRYITQSRSINLADSSRATCKVSHEDQLPSAD
ncbi:hypothetical protein GALL_553170 [mine drainage metagenome]|uniref:Uncharacterized protein n=1 Tax=mine drainage metagenome TaxID=410659 RepID=A0A1J5NVA3_9ZZZZ